MDEERGRGNATAEMVLALQLPELEVVEGRQVPVVREWEEAEGQLLLRWSWLQLPEAG
jgi:hypothetical protein